MNHDSKKTYLGDGVYAAHGIDDTIILTTEGVSNVTNEVVLEFDVYNALIQYACRVWAGGD